MGFLSRLLRWLRAEIFLGFLIASVFWAGVLGWQAANTPSDAEKQKCYEAVERTGRKAEECKTLWERTTSDPVAFFTFWLSISTIGLWVVTWQSGKRQSQDMTESIDVAERALTAGERAWIRVDIAAAGNLTVDAKGSISLPLAFVVTNCGNSPATHVRVYSYMMPRHPGPNKSLETYRRFSERVRTRVEFRQFDTFRSYTLFPNETKPIFASNLIMWQQVEEATAAWREAIKGEHPYFEMQMVGVIAYSIPFDTEQHQTGFSVDIRRAEDASAEGRLGLFSIDQASVPASEIAITPSDWGSPSID